MCFTSFKPDTRTSKRTRFWFVQQYPQVVISADIGLLQILHCIQGKYPVVCVAAIAVSELMDQCIISFTKDSVQGACEGAWT